MRQLLAFRLFASAAAWTLVVLPVTAFLLVSLYRQALERNFDARLNVYLTSLVASSTEEARPRRPTRRLRQPIFGIPFSGWYWQIKPLGKARAPTSSPTPARPAAQPAERERR